MPVQVPRASDAGWVSSQTTEIFHSHSKVRALSRAADGLDVDFMDTLSAGVPGDRHLLVESTEDQRGENFLEREEPAAW